MSAQLSPIIGHWYKNPEGDRFEVVAMDPDENHIEIQYYGGEIDELDFDSWDSLGVESIAAPEDWSGAYDEMERDDLGYTDMNLRPEGQGFSLEDFE
jgi:hypothetical protein